MMRVDALYSVHTHACSIMHAYATKLKSTVHFLFAHFAARRFKLLKRKSVKLHKPTYLFINQLILQLTHNTHTYHLN